MKVTIRRTATTMVGWAPQRDGYIGINPKPKAVNLLKSQVWSSCRSMLTFSGQVRLSLLCEGQLEHWGRVVAAHISKMAQLYLFSRVSETCENACGKVFTSHPWIFTALQDAEVRQNTVSSLNPRLEISHRKRSGTFCFGNASALAQLPT